MSDRSQESGGSRDRRGIEHEDIRTIAQHYLRERGYGLVDEYFDDNGWWVVWECPGCGNETFRANLKWGKAGCRVEGCPAPELKKWSGIVEHFEGAENFAADGEREKTKKLKRIALGIIEAREAELREEEETARRAEEELRRREEQAREREEAERLARQTAQNAAEQRLLDEHRARDEKSRQQQERERRQRAAREREERSTAAVRRVLVAESPIAVGEALVSAALGIALLISFYYGIGWLNSFAGYAGSDALYGMPLTGPVAQPAELADGGGPLASLAASLRELTAEWLPGWLVAWRFPLGVLVGGVAGLWLCWSLGRERRRRWRFPKDSEGEHLSFYAFDDEKNVVYWREREVDAGELTTVPVKRFVKGTGAVAASPFVLLWVAAVGTARGLRMDEWPWERILWRLLVVGAVSVAAYLFISGLFSGEWALLAALIVGGFGSLWGLITLSEGPY